MRDGCGKSRVSTKNILVVPFLKLGTTKDAKIVFGDMKNLLGAYYQIQQNIYQIV